MSAGSRRTHRSSAFRLALGSTFALLATTGIAHAGATLDAVKKNGFVKCGVSDGLPGFSYTDAKGNVVGIDADFCRAVASAVFGDATKVKFTPLTAKERFTALQSGEVDVLSRNSTWSSSRDTALGLDFVGVIYYDGQGFLVNRKLGVKSAKELDGATICTESGTTSELNLTDYFRARQMNYTAVTFSKSDESAKSLEAGRCDVLTSDQSMLYAQRIKLASPDDYVVLPEVISKEPLGPAVRHGDSEWEDIVRWTLFVLLDAEELGITSKNVDEMLKSAANPDARRLLGTEGERGKDFGLANDWAAAVIRQNGNYGEMFERNLGEGSPLKIKRGQNALWNQGGLQYAPPFR